MGKWKAARSSRWAADSKSPFQTLARKFSRTKILRRLKETGLSTRAMALKVSSPDTNQGVLQAGTSQTHGGGSIAASLQSSSAVPSCEPRVIRQAKGGAVVKAEFPLHTFLCQFIGQRFKRSLDLLLVEHALSLSHTIQCRYLPMSLTLHPFNTQANRSI